jgi:hypothetical protein
MNQKIQIQTVHIQSQAMLFSSLVSHTRLRRGTFSSQFHYPLNKFPSDPP